MLTYYINLAARSDRRAFMQAQFERLGLSAQRIEAITPAQVPAPDLDAYCHPRRNFWMSPGERACALSHFLGMRLLLASSASCALILEDDVALSPRLPSFLAEIDRRPPRFDLLRVETCQQRLRVLAAEPPCAGIEIARFVGYDSGAGGYVVSRQGARRILGDQRSSLRPIDQALFDTNAPMGRELELRQTIPGLCVQSKMENSGVASLASDIGTGDGRPAEERAYAWKHRWYRVQRAIYRDTIVAFRKQWFQRVRGARLMRIPFQSEA